MVHTTRRKTKEPHWNKSKVLHTISTRSLCWWLLVIPLNLLYFKVSKISREPVYRFMTYSVWWPSLKRGIKICKNNIKKVHIRKLVQFTYCWYAENGNHVAFKKRCWREPILKKRFTWINRTEHWHGRQKQKCNWQKEKRL